ncbi:MAG TPA: phosphate ABC transporter permease subunit PstC [Candidatus Eisenbacteria bacterium]|nr:phosphate ABC transporter permease subunit PstC [Candidatus Eisenbacteria bacterium]
MKSLLFVAALSSSIVIILIILFLFKEGAGLFGQRPLEFAQVMVAHPSLGVRKLEPAQIRYISEGKITDASEIGGEPGPIHFITYDDLDALNAARADSARADSLAATFAGAGEREPGTPLDSVSLAAASERLVDLVAVSPRALAAVFEDELTESPRAGDVIKIDVERINPINFLFGKAWYPTSEPAPQLGILSLIIGSLVVTIGAILVALPLGLAGAIYLSEVAHPAIRAVLKPAIEILAGIPSVVFGFFGLVVLVPFIQRTFDLVVGETALAGIIMLAIMSLPTVISVSEDALNAVPRSYREASLALGATRWQTIVQIVVPAALSGVTAAAMLGVGRAVGETMTVLMVTGNAAQIPHSLLVPVRTLTATIAAELGEAPQGGLHYEALFAIGIVLFVITFLINLLADVVNARYRRAD